jgi:ABC-type phosphate transport system substrate-binding protein
MSVRETIYADRDNPIALVLQEDDENITEAQMLAITKIGIKYDPDSNDNDDNNGLYYNSDDHGTKFDWTTYADEAKIVMKLGTILPVGADRAAELIIYNAANTNGIVWSQLYLTVSDEAETS